MRRIPWLVWSLIILILGGLGGLSLIMLNRLKKIEAFEAAYGKAAGTGAKAALAADFVTRHGWLTREMKSQVYSRVATEYGRANAPDSMAAFYRLALAAYPEDEMAMNNLAYEWAVRGEMLDSAEALSRRSLQLILQRMGQKPPWGATDERWQAELKRSQAMCQDTYGWVLFKKGDYPRALGELSLANRLASDPTVEYHLGMALYRNGRGEEARQHLATAVAGRSEDSDSARQALREILAAAKAGPRELDDLVYRAKARIIRQRMESDSAASAVQIGLPAPDFTLPDLDGNSRRLSQLRGKVVVVDFWATWCRPCMMSLPLLQRTWQAYQGRGVVFAGLSVDEPGKRDAIARVVRDKGLTFTILLGQPLGKGVDVQYKVTGIPTTFVIDQAGIIRYRHIGYFEGVDQLIGKEIERLLAE